MFYPHLFGYPRTAKGRPYKLYVRPYTTRSASERKQIIINVQSKRVYERIVIACGGSPLGYPRTANGRPYTIL